MTTQYIPLDKDLAHRAHAGTSFSPEKRAASELSYHKKTFETLQTELGDFFEQKHADKLRELWTVYLHSHSQVMSPMITGPARFPTARNLKRCNWADHRLQAITEYCANLKKWKRKADKQQAIENAGGELAVAKTKLEREKTWHITMKAANKIIRGATKSGTIDDEIKGMLLELGIERGVVERICIPDYAGCRGFASYRLTNSNARIKNTALRVTELENREAAKKNGIEPEVFPIEGGAVTYDYAENRINVKHEQKPDRAIRAIIKSHGFRWSRSYSTWTRKMTPAAKFDTYRLISTLTTTTKGTNS